MNSSHNRFYPWVVTLLLLGVNVAYANTAGYVQFVNGEVQLTTAAGQTHKIQKGDAVNEGDTLISAKTASAQIKMQDGGFVAVRPDTQLKFDSFKFSGKEDGSEQSFFSLFKGGFRAVTGLIGRINKPSYRITTPTSTIGIRGTDHETFVVALGSELAAVAPVGAYNKVNLGETYMATDSGTIFVLPNQMGFAGAKDQMPQLQPINTNIFTVAAAPTPQGELKKEEGQEEVRETAVVDNTSQQQAAPPEPAAAEPGNVVTTNIIQLPVNTTNGIPLTGGGGTTPTIVLPVALNNYGHEVVGPDIVAGIAYILNHYDVMLPGTSYQLDSANNLVRILNGFYVDGTHGLANAAIQFSGGVAQDFFKTADGSIYLGRWQGGNINVTDLAPTVPLAPFNVALGPASVHWLINTNPPAGYVQTLVGTASYTLAGATRPTDALGNVGTLTSASFTADFTNQLVNMALGINFANKTFSVNGTGIPIFAENAWGTGTVACTGAGCDPFYGAVLWGRLAGNQAASASLAYNLLGSTDLVQGTAAFTTATPPTVLAGGPFAAYTQTDLAVAYASLDSIGTNPFPNNTFIAAPADTNSPAVPSIANQPFLIDRYAGNGPGSSVTHTFSGTTTVGEAPTTIPATGIQFGRYDSTQGQMVVAGTTYTNLTPGTYLSGGAVKSHWIVGPAIDPVYLPEVLTGTAAYTLAGGTVPTALTGAVSSLNSASLSVNFTQQLVSLNLGLTVGMAAWTASTTNAPLEVMYWNNAKAGFRASTPPLIAALPPGYGTLTVSCGVACTGTGTVSGQLTGNALNGAILSYVLGNGIVGTAGAEQVTGVAAFTGTPQNTATPYRIAGLSGIDWAPPANVSAVPIPGTLGGYTNAGTVLTDVAGNVTQFNTSQPFSNGSAMTVGIGTATPAGLGTDPVSGISWGRWVGGALSQTDLATNTTTTHQNTVNANGTGAALSTHWIASPTLAGPVTLPVSGTYNYVLAGGTAPTDSLGNVGTLNGATLSANFTTQTVAVGVNVTTAGAGNLVANGSAIPIEQKSTFNGSTAGALQGGNPGSLTVTGSVAGTPQGHVVGAFGGAGGIGAAMIYGLVAGNGVIVNGTAAFHR